jgi:hypothetical protein
LELKVSLSTLAVNVVDDCGSALGDGEGENFLDCPVQAPGARCANSPCVCAGMNPSPKKGFVGINVAEPPQELLVEQ